MAPRTVKLGGPNPLPVPTDNDLIKPNKLIEFSSNIIDLTRLHGL
jgi:hypothetical protein